jgi:hypothetical protein
VPDGAARNNPEGKSHDFNDQPGYR